MLAFDDHKDGLYREISLADGEYPCEIQWSPACQRRFLAASDTCPPPLLGEMILAINEISTNLVLFRL
ncbi:hypothetical protein HanRHA438_Chr17g0820661 [Helianthus annuus]|nr:hypothetical protein HanRHA438_Chr17g0820661 [Helianthus annuus]